MNNPHHLTGCDFHEDSSKPPRDKDGKFVNRRCSCEELEQEREEWNWGF